MKEGIPAFVASPTFAMQAKGCVETAQSSTPHVFNEDYVVRLRNGDEETAKHFDFYFRRLLHGWLWGRFTTDQEEELIGTAMTTALGEIINGQPRDASRLPAYVTGICVNLTRLSMRHGFDWVRWRAFEDLDLRDTAPNQEEKLQTRQKAESVRKVLGGLERRDREILVALFFHEKDRGEICREHGIGREALRLILFRARKRFQREWAQQNLR